MVGARTWSDTGGMAHEQTGARPADAEARSCRISSRSGLETYAQICSRGLFSPAQSAAWMEAWAASIEPDYIVATIVADGEPVFGLALEVTHAGPFKVARFMGGKHANGNFPAATRDFAASAGPADFQALFRSIRQARPDIDIIALERMVAEFEGAPNPLLALPHSTSPNLALEVELAPGFEAISGRSKKMRTKHRRQIRQFEAAGGYRRIEAKTHAEVTRLIEGFFAQKEIRLTAMGMANAFGDSKVQKFFHRLFTGALEGSKPAFVLHAVEVAGKLRAISGSSRSAKRVTCEFMSIAEDDLTRAGPGEFIGYENIREAAEQGLHVYSFGVGDEAYKRRWCDIEVRHFDVIAPLGLKGHMLARGLRATNGLTAAVRNNPTLWKVVKSLRRRIAGEKPEIGEKSETNEQDN